MAHISPRRRGDGSIRYRARVSMQDRTRGGKQRQIEKNFDSLEEAEAFLSGNLFKVKLEVPTSIGEKIMDSIVATLQEQLKNLKAEREDIRRKEEVVKNAIKELEGGQPNSSSGRGGHKRIMRGPKKPMRVRKQELEDYLRANPGKHSLREVVNASDIPSTTALKAAALLLDEGKLVSDAKPENGRFRIEDTVEYKAQSVRAGEGVR